MFDSVKDITLSGIEVIERSEMDLHRQSVCFLAIYV